MVCEVNFALQNGGTTIAKCFRKTLLESCKVFANKHFIGAAGAPGMHLELTELTVGCLFALGAVQECT